MFTVKGAAVEILLIALMLIVAVLASNVISKFLPAVATPLVQIALGAVLSFFIAVPQDFELPTELFLCVFVAPLIYSDSRAIDRVNAWKNRWTILKLAIGLVIVMCVVMGFTMGYAIPSLPLAAAFVLGAALSPTDPVAVSALGESSATSVRQKAIMQAESIVNDATGVVVFNLALAALVTGSFSLVEASGSFLFLFFGGIVMGLAFGLLFNAVSSVVRKLGCDDVVFHVLLDLAVPFMTFLASEAIGVSPIMAVMVCALVFKIGIGKVGPEESRMNIVSNSFWSVISFGLNGFVFVMLGFQLKSSIADIMSAGVAGGELAFASLLLVTVLVGLRFLWITGMELITHFRLASWARKTKQGIPVPERQKHREDNFATTAVAPQVPVSRVIRNAAVLTFAGGTKGAITLSVAMSVPYAVSSRSLIVFLVSVAVIVTFILTNVLVPILAPAPKRNRNEEAERERRARVNVLRGVVERLSLEATDENRAATQLVMADYNQRIQTLRNGLPDTDVTASHRIVRAHALRLEIEHCNELMESGEIAEHDGYAYLSRLDRMLAALGDKNRARWLVERGLRRARGMFRSVVGLLGERVEEAFGIETDVASMREVQRRCAEYVVAQMKPEVQGSLYPVEDVMAVLIEYRRAIELLDSSSPSLTTIARREVQKEEIQLRGVGYELEGIQNAFDEGLISRDAARRMKDTAYLMRLDLENLV